MKRVSIASISARNNRPQYSNRKRLWNSSKIARAERTLIQPAAGLLQTAGMTTPALISSPAQSIKELLVNSRVQRALKYFSEQAEEITNEHVSICSIPAPPFAEQDRAEH